MRNELLGLALFSVLLGGCDQPQVQCVTAHGGFATRFTLKSNSGMCLEQPGDIVGLQTYNPTSSTPTNCGADGTCFGDVRANLDALNLGIQASYLGNYAYYASDFGSFDEDPNHHWYSLGAFADVEPDDADFCSVPALSAAEQVFPAVDDGDGVPGGEADFPGGSIKYEWSNTKVYVVPAAPGTQFTADVKVTEDGCTTEYSVLGMWPPIDCTMYDPETGEPMLDAEGNYMPDNQACDPNPHPELGFPFGSGINPDFKPVCDPTTLLCMQGSGGLVTID